MAGSSSSSQRGRNNAGKLLKSISTSLILFNQTVYGKNLLPLQDYEPFFNDWMAEYSMTISDADYPMRLQIFADTHDVIETHNSGLFS
jgi:hypothetical protein